MYGAAQSVTAPLVLIPGPHGRVRLAARPSTHRLLLEKRERERGTQQGRDGDRDGGGEMNEERDREKERALLFIIFRAVVIFHL